MLTTRLNIRRTARLLNRGGFTLVELLVVIGIIAILAGVALGPITNGIKKAKQSSGTQQAHAIGLAMYSFANDNSQLYPDKSGGSAAAQDVARGLLAGGYITDATVFNLSGDTNSSYQKVSSSTNGATSITTANIAWDFLTTTSGAGVSSTQDTFMPLLWSTLNGATPVVAPNVSVNSPITAVPISTNPFGVDGVAVFYINNSAAFVSKTYNATTSTTSVTLLPGANAVNATTGYSVATGT